MKGLVRYFQLHEYEDDYRLQCVVFNITSKPGELMILYDEEVN